MQPHRNQQKQPVLTNMYLCVLLRVHSSWGFWPFYAACWFQWSSCWLFSSLIYKMSLIIMTRHVHGNINTISVDKREKLCLLHFLFCWHTAAECRTPDELMEKMHEAEHLEYIISLITLLSSVLVYCNTELHRETENTDSSLQVYDIIRGI